MSLDFLLISLIVVATPGTGVIYTVAAGLARGTRASIVAAAGCTLGVVPHMAAAITGVAALLNASAVAFGVVKYLGVAYLVYLAWRTLRDEGTIAVEEQAPSSDRTVITTAVLINVLHPKLTTFFFAFLPQFVAPGSPHAVGRMLGLSTIFMALTFAVFALYGVLAARAREQVLARPRVMRWLRRAFAGSFLALGTKLALTKQ